MSGDFLTAYRAEVETGLGLLELTSRATGRGRAAYATMAGDVRAALGRLADQAPILARKDDQAAAILARETLAIEGLMGRFSAGQRRAITAGAKGKRGRR